MINEVYTQGLVKVDKDDYYVAYKKMSEDHDFPVLNRSSIDEMFMYFEDGVILYSCLVWTTFSDMCLIGFPVSNLNVLSTLRKGKLTKFIGELSDHMSKRGYKVLWTTSATERVIQSLEENGFKKGDEDVQTYIKVVS